MNTNIPFFLNNTFYRYKFVQQKRRINNINLKRDGYSINFFENKRFC